MRDYLVSWSDQPHVDFYARAMQRANEAILARMNQPFAHLTKAYLLMFKTKSGDVAQTVGRYEEVLSDMDRAMRIGPHDPYIGLWHEQKGRALLGLKRHGEAIQEGLKAIDEGYRTIIGYTALAAFYGAADKIPEAKSALAEAIKSNPKLSVAWFLRRIPSYINSPPDFS